MISQGGDGPSNTDLAPTLFWYLVLLVDWLEAAASLFCSGQQSLDVCFCQSWSLGLPYLQVAARKGANR